jgi:Tfp pilus assembly protein PilE
LRSIARSARVTRLSSAGMTLIELMVVGLITSIVILAIVTMYLTSMEAWSQAGARLALQQNADRVFESMVSDIRAGTQVTVTSDSLSMTIVRTLDAGDSTVAIYTFDAGELTRGNADPADPSYQEAVLLERITWLRFDTSYGGIKARIRMILEDDMGTSALEHDDVRVQMESAAVCRNRLEW